MLLLIHQLRSILFSIISVSQGALVRHNMNKYDCNKISFIDHLCYLCEMICGHNVGLCFTMVKDVLLQNFTMSQIHEIGC